MVVDCLVFCCYNRFTITERDRMIYKLSSSGRKGDVYLYVIYY